MTDDIVQDQTDSKKERRRESKEVRREQLMRATIQTIAAKGYAGTKLADVAVTAGLSRGIVNFHFESKDKLFLETLHFMSEEYTAHWRQALETAGPSPAARIEALVLCDLDAAVCSDAMISAWFAFWAEASNRADYRKLCWSHDDDYLQRMEEVCTALKAEGDYAFDPAQIGALVYSMQEGLWLRLMVGGGSRTRREALGIARAALASLFPRHFDEDGCIRPEMAPR
jgi:AcrR family transcriptional regulator